MDFRKLAAAVGRSAHESLLQLVAVQKQKELMISYLRTIGFTDVKLRWKDIDTNEYSTGAGWFIEATKGGEASLISD